MVGPGVSYEEYSQRASDKSVFWAGFAFLLLACNGLLFHVLSPYLAGFWRITWFGVSAFAFVCSIGVKVLERRRSNRVVSFLGRWSAFLNVFIVLSTLLLMVFYYGAGRLWPSLQNGKTMSLSLAFALSACVYALWEARSVRTVYLTHVTHKLPVETRLRIVQLSDLHIGGFVPLNHLQRIIEAVCATHPDMVVITGDIVDGFIDPQGDESALFHQLTPPYGIWVIPGNHDHYHDIERATDFMRGAGMNVLQTEIAEVGGIVLVGMDDRDHFELDNEQTRSVRLLRTLTPAQREKFILVLRHRPLIEKDMLGMFQLQLSGHTHGGQLFPLPSSHHKIPGRSKGFDFLEEGVALYVNNGAGFVGPPMRFFAPPEITVIDLVSSRQSKRNQLQ